ncbi:MAG: hypothetical protein AB7E79_15170 [Rhodospirillaceae bacterium]
MSALLIAAFAFVAAHAADMPDTRKTLNATFPREVEIALALSGGPAHLRDGAAVYVYGAKGFEKVKDGTNGFTCLVNRDGFFYGTENFKPTCWDAEGKTSYVPVCCASANCWRAERTSRRSAPISTPDSKAESSSGRPEAA